MNGKSLLINKDKLKNIILAIAGKMKFRPAIIEKDYYLTIILNRIGSLADEKIVFKGGTLFNKVYLNYHRLSEDLDFTYYRELTARSQRSKAITPIRKKMPAFLKALGMTSDNPHGDGFNNSTQYVFKVQYPSLVTAKNENIKIEISLRQHPLTQPVHKEIKHFYQDPFTGENLIPTEKVLSLSLNEAVAEKLKAAISRKVVAIRDYYDLWHIDEYGFNFLDVKFIKLFKRKLSDESHKGDFRKNFGLNEDQLLTLRKQVGLHLMPVIRAEEQFDLQKVIEKFNRIFSDKRFV